MQAKTLIVRGMLMMNVLLLAGCSSLQHPPADISGLRIVAGTSLIGAKGATKADQDKINRTAAGLCAGKVWTASECQRHGEALQ